MKTKCKVVIIGESGVGKSSLIQRFARDHFGNAECTIQTSFSTKDVAVGTGDTVQLQLWDTASAERYHRMAPMYFRGAAVCILVFVQGSMPSLDAMIKWHTEAVKTLGEAGNFVVAESKNDLPIQDEHVRSKVLEYCHVLRMPFYSTSAKTGQGVRDLFQCVGELGFREKIGPYRRRRVEGAKFILRLLWRKGNGCFAGVLVPTDVLELLCKALETTMWDSSWGVPLEPLQNVIPKRRVETPKKGLWSFWGAAAVAATVSGIYIALRNLW